MNTPKYEVINRMLNPRSVAVFGAMGLNKFAGRFVQALLDMNYEGRIYPIHPKAEEAMGLTVYQDLKSVGEPVDLACICVPREKTPEVLQECLDYGVPGAQILTAGFNEAGDEVGRQLEREITDISRRGIRVLGPNCFGIYTPNCGLTILPGNEFSRFRGEVAFISQSGGVCADLGVMAEGWRVNFSHMVSYGNACDLSETDLIEYFTADSNSKIIAGYLEGIRDKERFVTALKAAAAKKPVVIWKAGLSKSGSRAVVGHTGSMAGDRLLWEGLARQANITLVSDLKELLDTVMAFQFISSLNGNRLAVVGGGGAISVLAADLADSNNLQIPPFSRDLKGTLEKILPPPGNNLANPCDVGSPLVPASFLVKLLEIIADQDNIDALAAVQIPYHFYLGKLASRSSISIADVDFSHFADLFSGMKRIREQTSKPMITILRNITSGADQLGMEAIWRRCRDLALDGGFPVYTDMRQGFGALQHVIRYYARQQVK